MSAARTEASLRRYVWLGVIVTLLLVAGAGGWAATAQLASAVIAPGTLTLANGASTVRATVNGTVEAIAVRDGDVVAAGDVVVRLARGGTPAQRAALDDAVAAQRIRVAAQRAMRDGADSFTAGKASTPLARAALEEARRAVAEEAAGRAAMAKAAASQQAAQAARIAALTARPGDDAAVATAKAAAAAAEVARLAGAAARRDGHARTIEALEARLAALVAQQARDDREAAAAVLRAPAGGTVFELGVNGPGALVRAGETVATIVPGGAPLIVEARIDPRNVDEIHVGQAASVSLDAINSRTAAPRDGTVTFVGAQASRAGDAAFYTVRIAFPSDPADEGVLRPGMPVTAFITTGTQTAAAYLLRPLTEQIARAWRES